MARHALRRRCRPRVDLVGVRTQGEPELRQAEDDQVVLRPGAQAPAWPTEQLDIAPISTQR